MLEPVSLDDLDLFCTDSLLDGETLRRAAEIVEAVRGRGAAALRGYVEELDGGAADQPLLLGKEELREAYDQLEGSTRELLCRVHQRISGFARRQLECIRPLDTTVPGGRAGHRIVPVGRAGCYVPGGRYPLPSSALMTVTAARVAGCEHVVMACPQRHPVILAAGHVAGADQMLWAGGAHAVAALAFGIDGLPPRDVVVGPGNRWVTAAKKIVVGTVGIDMLAGPSELVVLADDSCDAELAAADLLAQAEHDDDARPILVTHCREVIDAVNARIAVLLAELPTHVTARRALGVGGFVLTRSLDESVSVCNRIAPEHLALFCRDAESVHRRIVAAGTVFVGSASAEVFGDYGIGPNHTLPTGGTARFASGLSVMSFLRLQTWLQLDSPVPAEIVGDTAAMAELEGLSAHRAASLKRIR